jgi:hypothetical protein
MVPLGFIAMHFVVADDHWYGSRPSELSGIAAVTGVLAVLTLSTTAANGIVSERVNQTFEILLTTPMSAHSILRQKAMALRPLVGVLSIPLLSPILLEGLFRNRKLSDFVVPILTVAVSLPLVVWISIWAGLWCRTRIRAISLALALIVGWCALPVFVLAVAGAHPEPRYRWDAAQMARRGWGERRIRTKEVFPTRYLFLLSPIFMPVANEFGDLERMEPNAPWIPVLVNFTFYGAILFGLRRHCLRNADRYLRR